MKKITYLIISLILLIFINACSGYKPIFGTSNLQFEIVDHSIIGDKKLGNQIYSKLYNLSNSNKNNPEAQNIHISIEVLKDKIPTVKNSTGKILEYEINLDTNIIIKDFLTEQSILNQSFNYSIPYKVQDAHSDTLKLENKNIDNLIDKTYQDALVQISEVITSR